MDLESGAIKQHWHTLVFMQCPTPVLHRSVRYRESTGTIKQIVGTSSNR